MYPLVAARAALLLPAFVLDLPISSVARTMLAPPQLEVDRASRLLLVPVNLMLGTAADHPTSNAVWRTHPHPHLLRQAATIRTHVPVIISKACASVSLPVAALAPPPQAFAPAPPTSSAAPATAAPPPPAPVLACRPPSAPALRMPATAQALPICSAA